MRYGVVIVVRCSSLCAGGLTGAGAKITGAVGDVFAKLTFDENFQDKRQQQKTQKSKLGSKFGGFAKVCTYIHVYGRQITQGGGTCSSTTTGLLL